MTNLNLYKLQVRLTVVKRITAFVQAENPAMAVVNACDHENLEFDESEFEDFFVDCKQSTLPCSTPELIEEDDAE